MNKNLKEFINGLLIHFGEYGLKAPTIKLYYNIYHSLAIYCFGNYDIKFNECIFDEFTRKAYENYSEKKWCYEYFRLSNRAINLLKSYYETGTPDYSYKSGNYKYSPTSSHMKHIENIVTENRLVNDAKLEMDQVLRHFFCFIENRNISLENVNDPILIDFLEEGFITNSGTIYRVTRALRFISEYLKKYNIGVINNDYSMLTTKSSPIRVIEPYSKEEVIEILKVINTKTSIGLRDYAIFLLAYETGLRGGDIIKLNLHDINWITHTLEIMQGKTNKKLVLPLNNEVLNALADYILNSRPTSDSSSVFLRSKAPYIKLTSSCSLGNRLHKYQSHTDIIEKPLKSFHSLRRGFATELSLNGIPLPEISELLGHKDISEDGPYLTYNRSQILFCAIDFDEIPIISGVYANEYNESEGAK
jgi:site-specific recombinase XerD